MKKTVIVDYLGKDYLSVDPQWIEGFLISCLLHKSINPQEMEDIISRFKPKETVEETSRRVIEMVRRLKVLEVIK